ncbi:hypothetical protein Godav_021252, partial [Gossypium davidsonii]|nr:hypothetical protein [Gossypium davidsonii]MBA0644177.1 hypothetical protein [Gossypium klotzschianum]
MRVYVRLDVRALLKRRKKIVVPHKWEMGTTGVRHLLARGGRFGPPHFEEVLLGVGFYLNNDILTALLCRPFLSNETLKLKRPWLEESTSCSSPLAHVKECASPCGVLYGKKLVARRM